MPSAGVFLLAVILSSMHICMTKAETSSKGDQGDAAISDSISSADSRDLLGEATYWKGIHILNPPPGNNKHRTTKPPKPHGNEKGWEVVTPFTFPPSTSRRTKPPKPHGNEKGWEVVTPFTFPPSTSKKRKTPKPQGNEKGWEVTPPPPPGNNKGNKKVTREPQGKEYPIEAVRVILEMVLKEIKQLMDH